MDAPLALYRRYRPETFAEVIGQDHVTGPLRAALENNRVNHAYLFSGPRGCGKTTSARILARALNCERGPSADPCGECESCQDLSRNGPGSIDVIEIDAASHGGVDDARDLREKAFFAPVKSRFKVYIVDEAHMVTTAGFNALLKLVEEPPPHLRFIFATTEPDKVLPTIRSRTHHYPFRLIPPKLLSSYLIDLCEREGVQIEPAALPLVVRAGGGSARDTLSVLDQLLGGAGPDGVTHQLATGLLGYTPDSLLDEMIDAFAAGDGGTVFGVVDKIVESGQDPRRFTEDLLRRLRDLVIIGAVPDAPATGLVDVPEDAAERLTAQAARYGVPALTRAADLFATGLTEMRGATAPRLLLELVCSRVLLTSGDGTPEGLATRLDRIERRMDIAGPGSADAAPPSPPPAATASSVGPAPESPDDAAPTTPGPTEAPGETTSAASAGAGAPEPAGAEPAAAPEPAPEPAGAAEPEPAGKAAGLSLADVRRLWPDIVEAAKLKRRVTWIHLTQHAQVVAVDATTLTLGFNNPGARESFVNGGSPEIVRQSAIDVIGADWRVEAIIDPGAQAGGGPTGSSGPPTGARAGGSASTAAGGSDRAGGAPSPEPTSAGTGPESAGPAQQSPQGGRPQTGPTPAEPAPTAPQAPTEPPPWATDEQPDQPRGVSAAREALGNGTAGGDDQASPAHDADAGVDPDDPDAEDALSGADLLQRELGAQIIEEIKHD